MFTPAIGSLAQIFRPDHQFTVQNGKTTFPVGYTLIPTPDKTAPVQGHGAFLKALIHLSERDFKLRLIFGSAGPFGRECGAFTDAPCRFLETGGPRRVQ
jgi:hypothetical protein